MALKNSSIAIYRQIIDYFNYEIASGRIASGERVDSIRNLALYFKVNPNTVQKALVELERDGLVLTDRTNGKFVTDDTERIQSLKKELLKVVSEEFVSSVSDLNVNPQEVINQVMELWEEKE